MGELIKIEAQRQAHMLPANLGEASKIAEYIAASGLFGAGMAKNWETIVETGEFWAQALNLLSKVVVYGSVFAVGLGIYRYAVQGRSFPRLFDGGGDSPVVP